MKVIDASADIIDYGSMDLLEKIELAGRLCYKSEDKIEPGSAAKFVTKTAAHGHKSVLEMGHLTFRTFLDLANHSVHISQFMLLKPKYFQITFEMGEMIISATPRAIIDLYVLHPYDYVASNLMFGLCCEYPVFGPARIGEFKVTDKFNNVDEHCYYGVRFIIGRHTSHELVRHRPIGVLQESQRYCNYGLDKFDNEVTFIKPTYMESFYIWVEAMKYAEKQYFDLLKNNAPQVARTVLPNSTKTEVIVYANVTQWRHMLWLRTTPACDPSMLEVMIPLREKFAEKGIIVN